MCNKYLLLVLAFLLTGNTLLSQNIKIDKFYTDPFDISASTNTRKDLNGRNCALLKIQFVGNITEIEGNVIGKPIIKSNETWVYLSSGTQFVKINAQKHTPILIQFNSYNIRQVESNRTYILILESDLPADVLLSSGIQYATMMSEKDDLFPSWIENVNNNGYWLGISHPSINRIQARRMALTNALLSYLFATGKAKTKSYIENTFHESEEKNIIEYSFKERTAARLEHIRTDIINEYYNHRGEYIIACNIREDAYSEDFLDIKKNVICTNNLVEINNEIIICTESEKFRIHFDNSGSPQTSSFYFDDEKKSIYPISPQVIDYPTMSFMHNLDRREDIFRTEINNSFGFSQFEILNMLPLIADSIKVIKDELMTKKKIGMKIYNEYNMTRLFAGTGNSVKVRFTPEYLKRNELQYKVYKSGNLQYNDSIIHILGYTPIIKKPFLLSKEISFYETLARLASTLSTTEIDGRYSVEEYSEEEYSLKTYTRLPIITDFCIDWHFNTNDKEESKDMTITPFIEILHNQSSTKETKK